MKEINISRTIISSAYEKLMGALENDVIIVGAGPAGLTAAYFLAQNGLKTLVVEKKLSTGGGTWGGAAGNSIIVLEEDALPIAKKFDFKINKKNGLYTIDAIEFATGLAFKAARAGACIVNLTEFEDIVFKNNTISGIVVNSTPINMAALPVDPFCIAGRYIIDGTGHPAEVISTLQQKTDNAVTNKISEGPMDVEVSEEQVVARTGAVYPGVYAAGMSVCAVYNQPRMGPIFGGMLRSGRKAAELIIKQVASA
ncbi:MAG TPA: sulfide-dependent adenosine diphosphate thiazole synthase [Spirochaetota bacterium]|nr:sulfide-dependent adenosine diphosphate thiazole synthase [Spirochaetota bacterium]